MSRHHSDSEKSGYRPNAEQLLQYSRRDFLKFTSLAAAGAFGGLSLPGITPVAWGAPPAERVVRVHCGTVQDWDFSDYDFWNHVKQPVMNDMFARGICTLTGRTNIMDAWHDLLVGYQPGDKVCIKINMNSYDYNANQTCEMAYTVIESLKLFGVSASNIKIFDVVRRLPSYWQDRWDSDVEFVHYDNRVWDDNATIYFPHISQSHRIPTVLSQSEHLINLCLQKGHKGYVTGSMKNHFGSQEEPSELHDSRFDNIVTLTDSTYIKDRTRLIVTEGSYMTWYHEGGEFEECYADDIFPVGPSGHCSPNYMMFGVNPIAIDSVLGDIENREREARGEAQWSNDFIDMGAAAPYNLGPRGNGVLVPNPNGWSEMDFDYGGVLDYISFDLPPVDRQQIDALNLRLKNGEIHWSQLRHLIERYNDRL